jgi:hypothetical protein
VCRKYQHAFRVVYLEVQYREAELHHQSAIMHDSEDALQNGRDKCLSDMPFMRGVCLLMCRKS